MITPHIIVTPDHGKSSIVKALRLYTAENCMNCDPTEFILEGRNGDTSPWIHIREGEFPGIAGGLDRNPVDLQINSTYASGDTDLSFVEVHFHTNIDAYFEYRVSFPTTRGPTSNNLRFAELEVPGMLLPPEPSASPTPAPSTSPTKEPSGSPTLAPTGNPTAELPDGTLVNNILAGSTLTNFGCVNTGTGNNLKASDSTTNKVSLILDDLLFVHARFTSLSQTYLLFINI